VAAKRGKSLVANSKYFVWEMGIRDRKQPVRQVSKGGLALDAAKQLARIGAQNGKHDRSVTTSPRSRDFQMVAVYEGGSGENITREFKANKLVPAKERRRVLREYVTPETGVSFDPATGADLREVYPTRPSLPAPPEDRQRMRSQGWRFDPDTGESLIDEPEEAPVLPED